MTHATADGDADRVVVTSDEDGIRISPAAHPPPGGLRSALDVAGGLLVFDVRDLSAPPSLQVTDAAIAATWVDDVFGIATSSALLAAAADGSSTAIVFAPSATTDALARLAWGAWLHRWWPWDDHVADLDTEVLGVELAAIAWNNHAVFLDRQPAASLLSGDVPAALVRVLDGADARDIAAAAAQAAIELWDPDHPHLREVEDLADALAEDALAEDEESGGDARERAMARSRRPRTGTRGSTLTLEDYDLAADGADEDAAVTIERSSIDWSQVPPRVLDWSEDTVATTLAGRRLRVAVAAAPTEHAEDDLFARVYRIDEAGGAFPVVLLPLARVGSEYVAEVVLDRDTRPNDLAVDVYAPRFAHRPLIGAAERDAARESREGARGILLARSDAVRRARSGDGGRGGAPTGPAAPFLGEIL